MHARELIALASLAALSGCTPGRAGELGDAGASDAGAPCLRGEGALGEACACDDECGAGAPRCERDRLLDPGGTSYCTLDCISDPSACPVGYECTEGAASGGRPFCARCASAEPGVVPLAEPCLCDADCAPGPLGEETSCDGGYCRATSCLVGDPSSCPEGYGCEEGPGLESFCAECLALGEAPALEGEACGCSAECASGLVCRRGACRTPCQIEEHCGSLSCLHRTDETPSCQEPILDCLADGSSGPGEACRCNADCGAGAPFCLLGTIGDVVVDRCAATCTPGSGDCPSGTRCCGADRLLSPTCLADDVVAALGTMIQCAD